jgi:hypothetical protein
MTKRIIIVGRGHSGTRCIANTLRQSGLYMGKVNQSGDTIPGKHLYEAVKMVGSYVDFVTQYKWDFSELITMQPPQEYYELMNKYLYPHFNGRPEYGWKLPESALAMPWLVKMFPDAYYIHWVRDGRDNILSQHDTERLDFWNIPHIVPMHSSRNYCAAVSWKYHEDLIEATPKPKNWLKVRFEDFVLAQGETLGILEDYLDMGLVKIPVTPEPIGRWESVDVITETAIMKPQLERHGYVS